MDGKEVVTFEKALKRLQNLCARQEKCSWDVMQKLKQWGVENKEAQKILNQLVDEGYIDDRRYASLFVRGKTRLNKWGRIKITAALRQKKVDELIIREALQELPAESEDEILQALIEDKANHTKAGSISDLRVKLIRFGMSRGFELGRVVEVVDQIIKHSNKAKG